MLARLRSFGRSIVRYKRAAVDRGKTPVYLATFQTRRGRQHWTSWTLSDDRKQGGSSVGHTELVAVRPDGTTVALDDEEVAQLRRAQEEDDSGVLDVLDEDRREELHGYQLSQGPLVTHAMRFKGQIEPFEYTVPGTETVLPGEGFAVTYTPDFEPINLTYHDSLAIKLKSDGRPYYWNMRVAGLEADELIQGLIKTMKTDWVTLRVPLAHLIKTRRGRPAYDQGDFSYRSVTSFGFSATGTPGPFELQVAWVKAYRNPERNEETMGFM